jgi:NAD(P)-dependent dehydrogenase (short-subunit alcohol dehydrogenase family)
VSAPLAGRKAAISGASQGLGAVLAAAFLEAGADVLLGARGLAQLESVAAPLRQAHGADRVLVQRLDVADDASAQAFIARAQAHWGGLDVLVNNAGVHGPIGPLESAPWDPWVEAVQINLLGTVSLCRHALPLLRRSPAGRILNLSGGGATAPMPFRSAYAASKAAVVRFTETLACEMEGSTVTANAIAPGAMNTRLLDEVIEAGPAQAGEAYHQQALKQRAQGGSPPEKAAALCVALAGPLGDGISGKLISAVWDPWADFAELKPKFAGNDIYTLRRIVPKDRGQDF